MSRPDVLVVEISGKRPGTSKQRPTEKFDISYDHLIISNNSEGYETDWDIVNVPDDYMEWYKANIKSSDSAWYAPMNRSYAIKYAREHGYKYLIQADDNIVYLELSYMQKLDSGITKRYRKQDRTGMFDGFVDIMVTLLENSNAGMVGCALAGVGSPDMSFMSERYVYSLFGLKLDVCPDIFQGDFEDDVEYRLKLEQMGIPAVQIAPLKYSKTGQNKNADLSGCRKAYADAGVKRGEHMLKLYGHRYSCGMRSRSNRVNAQEEAGQAWFKHILTPFKVGVTIHNEQLIKDKLLQLFKDNAGNNEDKAIMRTKKVKL